MTRRTREISCLLGLMLVLWACDDGKNSGNNQNNTNNTNNGNCVLDGTFTIDATELISGACDLQVTDPSLKLRQIGGQVLLKFDSTSWTTSAPNQCGFTAAGPDSWWYNGVERTRGLSVTVTGDSLVAEITDHLDGTDDYGHTCDVRLRILATRTGPAPAGMDVGENGCGPVGCSASICAFGGEFDCAAGVCLLDDTGEWMETYCTRPCDTGDDCPEDFDCVQAQEAWDGAADGKYCKRWHAVCGNNILEEGEVCDDGNTEDGDGCSADCQHDEGCGNQRFEPGETCDAGAPGEWLECSGTCEIVLQAPGSMPLGVATGGPLVVALGAHSFLVVGYNSGMFSGDYEPEVRTARTTDDGQTWTSGLIPSADGWSMEPAAVAAHGSRVTVGYNGGWNGLRLAESTDGGVTWTPEANVAVPEGATEDDQGLSTVDLQYSPDGALWVAISKPGSVVVLRRGTPVQALVKVGELALPEPVGSSGCTLYWKPYRLDLSNGAGVHLHRTADGVRLTAGASCYGTNGYNHNLWSARFDAAGLVGTPVDLVAEAGLANTFVALVSSDRRVSPVVCLSEGQVAEGRSRCGEVDEVSGAWTFADTPAVTESWNAGGPTAVVGGDPGHWALVQDVSVDGVVRIHHTADAGVQWSHFDVPTASAWNRTLARVSATVVVLFEVDSNNEASTVRLDLSSATADAREYLFGEARRGDGSGMPWTFSCDSDGAGHALLAFSLPDTLRQWLHVVRPIQ